MGFIQDLTGGPQAAAAAQTQQYMNQYGNQATTDLGVGYGTGVENLNKAVGVYDPLKTLGEQYAPATTMYLNSLGLGGAAGNQAVQGAFFNDPGYQQGLNASLAAIQQRAAASGMGSSGATDMDRMTFAQNLQNQQYQNWQKNLASAGQTGIGLLGTAAAGQAGGYGALAGLGTQYGQDLAGVAGNVVGGDISAANERAAGQATGAKNLLNAGLSLATLAAGGAPGQGGFGSSLLGRGFNYLTGSGIGGPNIPMASSGTQTLNMG